MRTQRSKNRRSFVKPQSRWWNKVLPARGRRLALEPLEHRLVLSTFSVVNTDDVGVGSLRWAIEEANANAGPDAIAFNIPMTDANFVDVDSALPGGDPEPDTFVITPLSALPDLSDTFGGTTIDGSTQTAFTGNTNPFGPEVVLDGSAITVGGNGLLLDSANNQVHGLNVRNFNNFGLLITGDASTVTGNYIGTDATGTLAMSNGEGIRLSNVSGTMIGGIPEAERNLISGNGTGIFIRLGSADTQVVGNYIGTTADGLSTLGTPTLGTQRFGIHLQGDVDSLIGGAAPGAGNLISGNYQAGIIVGEQGGAVPSASQGSCIQGNRIGTTADGYGALGNVFYGIQIAAGGAYGVHNLTIGGTEPGAGNVISGNGEVGIISVGEQARSLKIQGNYIGTDVDGIGAIPNQIPNQKAGIAIQDAAEALIGGIDPAARNVISGNENYGIQLYRGSDHAVQGNFIGTNAAGTEGVPNGKGGVYILDASDMTVGGSESGARNVIADNGGSGGG